jgi:hypothetical protein
MSSSLDSIPDLPGSLSTPALPWAPMDSDGAWRPAGGCGLFVLGRLSFEPFPLDGRPDRCVKARRGREHLVWRRTGPARAAVPASPTTGGVTHRTGR